jgi:hypothetical protein
LTIQARLDERYGRGRHGRRRLFAWITVGVLALAATGALAWSTVSTAAADVDADVLGFRLVDEHTTTVSFQITGHSGREIACAVEALDEDFGVVGWKVVVYPPSGEQTRAYDVSVPTLGLATTGLVNSCWLP